MQLRTAAGPLLYCLKALRRKGAGVFEYNKVCYIQLPDGTHMEMDGWRFRLLCQKAYEEVVGR